MGSHIHHHLFTLGNPMLQTLTIGCIPLTLTLIYRSHIHLCLTHPHNTLCHISFSITQHVFLICQMVSALQWSNNQNRWRKYVSMSPPLFFQTKWILTLQALKRKIHERLHFQPLDQVYGISWPYPHVVGCGMLKFIAMQLVNDEEVKGMISSVRQSQILQCSELYANIKLHTLPTPNP